MRINTVRIDRVENGFICTTFEPSETYPFTMESTVLFTDPEDDMCPKKKSFAKVIEYLSYHFYVS